NPRADRVQLLIEPNLLSFKKTTPDGEVREDNQFQLNVQIGSQGGYLVIIERDPTGSLFLLFPSADARSNVELAHVAALQRLEFPTRGPDDAKRKFVPLTVGTERAKAILFNNKAAAAALL